MYVTIVNFNLQDMTPKQFAALCDELAPAFASEPGLLTKVWLADEASNTFGGVYAWRDETAAHQFESSELFKAVVGHPNLVNLTARGFHVLDGPTRVTRGTPAVAVA